MRGRPDLDAVAEGDVEFRRGAVVIRADRLSYDQAEDLARATGNVRHQPRRQRLQRSRAAAEGRALRGLLPQPDLSLRAHRRRRQGDDRIEFLDDQRAVAIDATYSSCSPTTPATPAWILQAGSIETRQRDQQGIATRRGAALLRRADPRRRPC